MSESVPLIIVCCLGWKVVFFSVLYVGMMREHIMFSIVCTALGSLFNLLNFNAIILLHMCMCKSQCGFEHVLWLEMNARNSDGQSSFVFHEQMFNLDTYIVAI